ncbi:RluA family pseudouridine synthase [Stratiformator vulcanicus]|uniref:Ribosomal large subunit pseudouridine synthase A n=1 Tax=Stratiformator vulcanicus TaxID=2527980 RepID=A0A517R588_9PLAN|nr:RluA family pseudouridine synthase [Stratiformator vulcanicus]QDT39032.1 Ribosomal large subunit pseudouridine synthase A [Stratiformator vulcanicus]
MIALFEDNHLIGCRKPAGLLTVGDQTRDRSLYDDVVDYLVEKYQKPGTAFLGVLHRLDRPVSGVVLFARTSKAAGRVSSQFRERTVRKIYYACVSGVPASASAVLRDHLWKDPGRNFVSTVSPNAPGAKSAALTYRVVATAGSHSLLEIEPQTGRSHQIRVQLASRGWPILGDVKYGSKTELGHWIALHALALTIEHPTRKEPLTIATPPPDEWSGTVPKMLLEHAVAAADGFTGPTNL